MINNFVGVGRTTKDIDLRYSQNGIAIANFTIAITRRIDKEKTDFIRCIAFKKTAELIAQYVKKGHQIGIEGSIQTGNYEKEGRTIYTTDVMVNNVQFLESRNSQQSNSQVNDYNNEINHHAKSPFQKDGEQIDINDDNLPF